MHLCPDELRFLSPAFAFMILWLRELWHHSRAHKQCGKPKAKRVKLEPTK